MIFKFVLFLDIVFYFKYEVIFRCYDNYIEIMKGMRKKIKIKKYIDMLGL